MSAERRAVLLLLALAVAGQAVHTWWARPGEAPGEVRLLEGDLPRGAAAHRDSAARSDRPLDAGERVDLDRAPAREIARLPRIGLALAKSIVADREAKGPFGSLQGLDRVSGIGPGLLRLIAPHAAFSGVKAGPPLPAEVPTGIPLAPAASGRRSDPAPGPLDLNTADSVALERLSGIGPTLAGRIVAYRLRHGPFAAVQDLIRVPGLGPGTLSRLKPSLTVGP